MRDFIVKNKRYGWIDEGVFKKRVNSRKHKMRMLDAYGIEESVVKELDNEKVTEIRIKEDDTGTVYIIPYPKFKEYRFVKNFQTPQYFIQLKHMAKYEKNATSKPNDEKAEEVPMLRLFE